jgi:hypothetical protein
VTVGALTVQQRADWERAGFLLLPAYVDAPVID